MKKSVFKNFLFLLILPMMLLLPNVSLAKTIIGEVSFIGGKAVPDSGINVVCRIYDASAGGELLWRESQEVFTEDGGFSFEPGKGDENAEGLNLNHLISGPMWVEFEIDYDVLSPRAKATEFSAPFTGEGTTYRASIAISPAYDSEAGPARALDRAPTYSTTLSAEGLSVDGAVESTSGGFKFPDGTVQTTSSAPTWHQLLTTDRFQLVMNDEAVLDRETGLVWDRSPSTTDGGWTLACELCYKRKVGGRYGWRLPTAEELSSLVDSDASAPKLPTGHPFTNVQSDSYWTITTVSWKTTYGYCMQFTTGVLDSREKEASLYHWCVRGGKGYDAY